MSGKMAGESLNRAVPVFGTGRVVAAEPQPTRLLVILERNRKHNRKLVKNDYETISVFLGSLSRLKSQKL